MMLTLVLRRRRLCFCMVEVQIPPHTDVDQEASKFDIHTPRAQSPSSGGLFEWSDWEREESVFLMERQGSPRPRRSKLTRRRQQERRIEDPQRLQPRRRPGGAYWTPMANHDTDDDSELDNNDDDSEPDISTIELWKYFSRSVLLGRPCRDSDFDDIDSER